MKPLASLVLVFLTTACNSATEPKAGDPFEVPLHQTVAVAGTPFLVSFDSVIEDSRCPEGVVCTAIWQGRAKVMLSVAYQSGPDVLIRLTLTTPVGGVPDSSTALVGGWFVEFRDLLPHPAVIGPPHPDYRAQLVIRPGLD